ncbi:MAG: DUF1015 domain-containing protein [Candidatus Omnitrophica bacterium]|nr:DUF1015 domain-containing protein [Candidatus Omnitrophota bacterium]
MRSFIKPFKAFFYNPARFNDLEPLVCPPYDVIKGTEKQAYQHKSRYNFANILLVNQRKGYKVLAKRFLGWIKEEVLVPDKSDAIYLYEQEFPYGGKKFKRVGFLGLLKLDKKGVVFPHENTLSAPKKDRFAVLKEVKANLSPIFVVSAEKLDSLSTLYRKYVKAKPFIRYKDHTGIRHQLWKIDGKKEISSLTNETMRRKLFIADGHHRFKVASRYYQTCRNKFSDLNYILAYFTHPSDGLLVLPTHRVTELKESFQEVKERLSADFFVQKVSQKSLERLIAQPPAATALFSFGMYHKNSFYFLKLKNRTLLGKISPQNRVYKTLDVWLLHRLVLKRFTVKNIEYVHRIDEVARQTTGKKTGFILRDTPLATVFSIAKKGKLLPQKSTYFYPKLPSGVLIRRFEH